MAVLRGVALAVPGEANTGQQDAQFPGARSIGPPWLDERQAFRRLEIVRGPRQGLFDAPVDTNVSESGR
jgi:hypothetical protein